MRPLRILVACEYSGAVRRALRALGIDAWSCDILPAEDGSPHHLQCDVREALKQHWDAVIAFPPCTHLCVSGALWFARKAVVQAEAIEFFMMFARLRIPYAIENPVGIMSSRWRKPDQIIQPWQFGHGETKATCLWLQGLPPLQPTHTQHADFFAAPAPVERVARIHLMPPSPDRAKERSRTYAGIAQAMATQWGGYLTARAAA